MKAFHLSIDYKGKHFEAEVMPLHNPREQGIPLIHTLNIEGKDYGTIRCTKEKCLADKIQDPELVNTIGNYIHAWYE